MITNNIPKEIQDIIVDIYCKQSTEHALHYAELGLLSNGNRFIKILTSFDDCVYAYATDDGRDETTVFKINDTIYIEFIDLYNGDTIVNYYDSYEEA